MCLSSAIIRKMMDEKTTRIKDIVSAFISHTAIVLPFDVKRRLIEMERGEKGKLGSALYSVIEENQNEAFRLSRPSCQDTGIVQYWIKCGALWPYINSLESALTEAVREATVKTPLRPNAVVPFEEKNTKNNIGEGSPYFFWDIIPDSDECEIYIYLAGGGCSLPARSRVFSPGEGYEGMIDFIIDETVLYGPNACPPLYIGVGIGATSEVAALNAKKALMREVGSHNPEPKVKALEEALFNEINKIGIGVQGLGGEESLLGLNIECTVRHPATFAVAVSYGCWSFRRSEIRFRSDLGYTSITHPEFKGVL